jgi:hypothetical protein
MITRNGQTLAYTIKCWAEAILKGHSVRDTREHTFPDVAYKVTKEVSLFYTTPALLLLLLLLESRGHITGWVTRYVYSLHCNTRLPKPIFKLQDESLEIAIYILRTHLSRSPEAKSVLIDIAWTWGGVPSRRTIFAIVPSGIDWSSGIQYLPTMANGILPHWIQRTVEILSDGTKGEK